MVGDRGRASAQVLPFDRPRPPTTARHVRALAGLLRKNRSADASRRSVTMILSETSEARVRGYLYVRERSLHSSLPAAVVADALREVESHIRDRVAESQPLPDERAALERVFEALGTP